MSNAIETKVCAMCEIEKKVTEFYAVNRSYCIECERDSATNRMRQYNATFRGKASQALQSSKKAVKRVEREQGIDVKNTLKLHEVMWVLADSECTYCLNETEESERQLDHITPMKYGGGNTFDNITMSCKSCNSLKNDLPVILHFIRECDDYQARKLIDRMASRSQKTFKEVFEQLTEDAKTYFEVKAAEATEKARTIVENGQIPTASGE